MRLRLGKLAATLALPLAIALPIALPPVQAFAGDITFWTWRQEDRAAYTELFNDFTKANPDIHVKFESFAVESYNTILSTALAAGRGGDVIHARAYGGLEQFAKTGYFLPLDTSNVPELANIGPDALAAETLRADKKVYAVPFASQTLGVFVNNDVFAKAGLTPPQTWEQLISVSKSLKEKGITPIANGTATGWMDEVFTSIFTGPLLGPDFFTDVVAGKTTFEDPRYVAALGKLMELRDFFPQGYTGVDYATGQQLFLSGRAAMFAGGSFEISNFRKQNPKINMDFIAPPAAASGAPRYVSKFFDGGYAVNSKTANSADALKLVRYMATKAYGDKFAALLGNISPIKGVVIEDKLLAEVARLNAVSVPYIMAVSFRYETPTGSELLQGAIQKMFAGSMTPAQVGAEVTQGIARYYVPFQKK